MTNKLACVFVFAISGSAWAQDLPEFESDEWLFSTDSCPVDVIPFMSLPAPSKLSICEGRVQSCWQSCWRGNGEDCFSLALYEEPSEGISDRSQALFHRSCELGFISGCTNRASGIYRLASQGGGGQTEALKCANATFEATCDRGDSWGCAMFGLSLTRGIGMDADYPRALEALLKACALGPSDDACKAAKALESEVRESLKDSVNRTQTP